MLKFCLNMELAEQSKLGDNVPVFGQGESKLRDETVDNAVSEAVTSAESGGDNVAA